jgi:protein O-GlcNAc transferase
MSGDDLDMFDFEAVDLAIDCRPSMGETQVLTLLGHGVPVLCVGEPTTSGRLAAAPLAALGLHELMVTSFKQLAARVLELSEQPERLAAIRDRIEPAFRASAYGNVRRIAGDLEQCFEGLAAGKAGVAGKSAAG